MDISEPVRQALLQKIAYQHLPENFYSLVEAWYWPLATLIDARWQQDNSPRLVSINGSQGSGKSTMVSFLKLLLTEAFNLRTAVVSIDDFYKTRQERKKLADDVHPLLMTRGVPGTHDVSLAVATIECLLGMAGKETCLIPVFDKSIDDRTPVSRWKAVQSPVDIILFEGWCNNAPVEGNQSLINPVNALEAEEDKAGTWRKFVNSSLKLYHEQLFSRTDDLIFLQAPSFEKVYEWRGLQEQKLRNSTTGAQSGIMDERQLKRFIEHFERITRNCLRALPDIADIVITMDEAHNFVSMENRLDGYDV